LIREQNINLLVDSEFFWYSLEPGDKIMLEMDYHIQGKLVLRQGEAYEVLAKTEASVSDIAFVVLSDITEELVSVHPFLVSDYLVNPVKVLQN